MISVLAMRRQFLLDLAHPSADPVLCDLLGLLPASDDVSEAERVASLERIRRLLTDPRIAAVMGGAADDMSGILDSVDTEDRSLWLVSYALAVLNLFESLGVVEVHCE